MADLKDLVNILGDDYKYISDIDPYYIDYIMEHPEKLKQLIHNLEYKGKYQLNMQVEQLSEYVSSTVNTALKTSPRVEEFYKNLKW